MSSRQFNTDNGRTNGRLLPAFLTILWIRLLMRSALSLWAEDTMSQSRGMKKRLLSLAGVVASVAACTQGSEAVALSQKSGQGTSAGAFSGWVGKYDVKSSLCSVPETGESCADDFDDCLSIRRGPDGYHVELRSTQAEQHVCAFDLTMKESNERLTFESEFGPVAIVQEDEALQISSAGIDPTALGLGFCGAHADIDGLRFPLSAKREIRGGCSLDAQH